MQERGVAWCGASKILLQQRDPKPAPRRTKCGEQADGPRAHDENLGAFNWAEAIDG